MTAHSSQSMLNWHTGETHGNSWDPDQDSEVCSTPPSLDDQLLTFSPKVSAVSCLGSQQHHQGLLAFLSLFWMLQRSHPTDRRWTFCVHHPGTCRLCSTPSWWHKEAPKPWQLLLLFLSPHNCSLQHISGARFSLLQERTGRAEENQEVMHGKGGIGTSIGPAQPGNVFSSTAELCLYFFPLLSTFCIFYKNIPTTSLPHPKGRQNMDLWGGRRKSLSGDMTMLQGQAAGDGEGTSPAVTPWWERNQPCPGRSRTQDRCTLGAHSSQTASNGGFRLLSSLF